MTIVGAQGAGTRFESWVDHLEDDELKYWAGYKYVVAENFMVRTEITGFSVVERLTELHPDGRLDIYRGYAWDGNSGPFPDLRYTIEASCIHDILCDYINDDLLPLYLQPIVDHGYYKTCTQKGMWWRAARQLVLAIRWYMTGKGDKKYVRPVMVA